MPSPTQTPVRSFPALPCMVIDTTMNYKMTVTTTMGKMEAVLDPKAAPTAVNNMYFLAQEHFYDGLYWYRVQSWVIQTGDPSQGEPPHAADDGQAGVQVEGEGVLICFDDESLKSHSRFFGGSRRET